MILSAGLLSVCLLDREGPTRALQTWGVAGILLLTAILSALVYLFLKRSLTSRILRLSDFAHRISQGDFRSRVEVGPEDEIGRLEKIFNAMADNLARARSNLEQKLESQKEIDQFKDNFLAMVSHELRTPLTAVVGFSDAILEGHTGPITEPQRRVIKSILEKGEHLQRLINNILDLEKIQSGKLKANPWTVPLEEIIDHSLSMTEIQAHKKGIVLSKVVRDKLPPVRVDVLQIQSVVTNLLSNAVKFTPPNGRVEVAAGLREANGTSDAALEVWVSDTGIGIPEEEREKVFFRFYQVQGQVNREYSGTGLGLALARELAVAHGGWLEIKDRPGWSTTFSFGLPVETDAPTRGIHLEKSVMNLPMMINGIIHLLKQEMGRDPGITFPLPVHGAPEHCVGDRGYLRGILINIIQNTIKYRDEGSTVAVDLSAENGLLTVGIENRGPAFSSGEFERVYREDGRAEGGKETEAPRFLSLRTAREILEALGGSLEIRNVTEEREGVRKTGVRFSLSLPLPPMVHKGGRNRGKVENTGDRG
jgi:signal transduction histidine kinase